MEEEPLGYDEIRNKYRDTPISVLMSIQPKWACDENIDRLIDFSLNPSIGKDYRINWVNVKTLVCMGNFLGLNPYELFSGDDASDYRTAKILDDWNRGKFIDPPEIYFENQNEVLFSDGRHRTIVAFHLKAESIPIAYHKVFHKSIELLLK